MPAVHLETPSLVPGDKLSRAEFLRRWDCHPEVKRAELLGGVVTMPPPVGVEHGDREGNVGTWLGVYAALTPGCASGHNTTSFLHDEPLQPDVNLRLLRDWGGASWVEDGFLHGAPELLAEISRTSEAYDVGKKAPAYEAAGVTEFLAVVLPAREIRWHHLQDGRYGLLNPDDKGILRSVVFPGLWLDGNAFLEGNMALVLATLQQGMASKEYADFVALLIAKKPQ
jgi:hypothetical protein